MLAIILAFQAKTAFADETVSTSGGQSPSINAENVQNVNVTYINGEKNSSDLDNISADIIIANFNEPQNQTSIQYNFPERIESALESLLKKYQLRNIKISKITQKIMSREEAQKFADQVGAKIIIYTPCATLI
jgi:hypothetical protein